VTFSVIDASSWVETINGASTSQPLGTSGAFVLTLDYGLPTEEKVLCPQGSLVGNTITGAIRGYDGTTKSTHAASTSNPVIHTYSSDVPEQANLGVTNAAAAQSTADGAAAAANSAVSTANSALAATNKISIHDSGVVSVGIPVSGTTPSTVVSYAPSTSTKYLATATYFIDNTGSGAAAQQILAGFNGGTNTTVIGRNIPANGFAYATLTLQSVYTGSVGTPVTIAFQMAKSSATGGIITQVQLTVQGIQ
jgi:hypothetical protein